MKVTVRLFATLRDLLPKDKKMVTVKLETDSTVEELLEHFKVSQEFPLIIKINGKNGTKNTVLENGDRVGIFPPVGGG
jgi:molybdopterin converting factor small subunit